MDNLLGQQLPIGLVLVFVQNYLKQQKWFPWLTYQSTKANHAFAILATGLATFGLHISHTGTFASGGSVLLTFPTGAVMLAGLWHYLQQYAVTKGIYTGLSGQLNPPVAQMPTSVTPAKPIPSIEKEIHNA